MRIKIQNNQKIKSLFKSYKIFLILLFLEILNRNSN
jgi:hypothetical protein